MSVGTSSVNLSGLKLVILHLHSLKLLSPPLLLSLYRSLMYHCFFQHQTAHPYESVNSIMHGSASGTSAFTLPLISLGCYIHEPLLI